MNEARKQEVFQDALGSQPVKKLWISAKQIQQEFGCIECDVLF